MLKLIAGDRQADKLPSYGFYPSLCTFISSFHSDRSIAAAMDGHCSSLKLLTVVFLRFYPITHSLSIIHQWSPKSDSCLIHSYVDDTTLHFQHSATDVQPNMNWMLIRRLTSDLSLVSDFWFCLMSQNVTFYNYLLDITFQITISFSSMTFNSTYPPH